MDRNCADSLCRACVLSTHEQAWLTPHWGSNSSRRTERYVCLKIIDIGYWHGTLSDALSLLNEPAQVPGPSLPYLVGGLEL